jgi:hypothetical protein
VKQIWKIASVFIISSLVMPIGVFAAPKVVLNSYTASHAETAQTGTVVIVKQTEQAQIIQTVQDIAQNSICSMSSSVTSNLVQNGGLFNLNQPATCFNIVTGKSAPTPSLAVVTVPQTATIVLSNHYQIAQTPTLLPAQNTQDTALPSLVFIASALLVIEEKKSVKKSLIKSIVNFHSALTIHQLGMARC